MKGFTGSFRKIIPSIRRSPLEVIERHPLHGERLAIEGREGGIEVFFHRAKGAGRPLVFEFHGGGFVLGDARKDDRIREIIKEALDVNVVGVNYRKAPEFPHPAALWDAYDAVRYFAARGEAFLVDTRRFAALGFSAGATLAAATALQAAESRAFSLCGQILHYPYLDGASEPSSKKRHPGDLPVEVMEAFIELYAGDEDRTNPLVSPLYAEKGQLSGVAPALLIMAGEDALCEEGLAYARRLREAGVEAKAYIMEEMHHGYMEDYYNQPCYDLLPEDTKALHSRRMGEQAGLAMHYTIEGLRTFFSR